MAKLPALPFIRSAITQGLSANAALRQYRELAGSQGLRGMRRQDFLRVYSETLSVRQDQLDAMARPKGDLPSGDDIIERSTEYATGYGSWVSIYQRTRGQNDLIHTPFLIKSRNPITPAEAEQRAKWYIEQEEPDVYNRITIGITYTGTNLFSPRQR